MISICHKEATGVECHSSSHKTAFCYILNLTNLNKGARKCNHHKKAFSESRFQEENGYFRLFY